MIYLEKVSWSLDYQVNMSHGSAAAERRFDLGDVLKTGLSQEAVRVWQGDEAFGKLHGIPHIFDLGRDSVLKVHYEYYCPDVFDASLGKG